MKKLATTLVAWGPPGLFLLTLIDSAGLPLPGVADTLMVFLAARSPENWFPLAMLAVTGSLIGSMILYYLARKGGEAFLDRKTATGYGKKFKEWYLRYGLVTIFVPAVSIIPITLKLPVFCAGALGVRPGMFAAVIVVARSIRYLGLAWLGRQMGEHSIAYLSLVYKFHRQTHKAPIFVQNNVVK